MSEEKIEEETYSLIFKTLKHPIRRKILRTLVGKQLTFSEILTVLSIDSGHLSYHIDNLGDLVRRSDDGKYELSSIGAAAVNLMSGVEERPKMLVHARRLKFGLVKDVLTVAALIILVVSIGFNVYYGNLVQSRSKETSNASRDLAVTFHISVSRATDISYLLRTYREGFGESEPSEDNIEALIEGFFHEMEHAYLGSLRNLLTLNPEQSEYKRPLYVIGTFIEYAVIWSESLDGGPTVRSVLAQLLTQAQSSADYSAPLAAFEELNNTAFGKIRRLSFEVAESFAPFNATRLDNTVNLVEESQIALDQWIEKFS